MTPQPIRVRRPYNVLDEAAGLLRLLAAVDVAHLLEDDENLDTLLSQITSVQCKSVADELDLLAIEAKAEQARHRAELTHVLPPGSSARLRVPASSPEDATGANLSAPPRGEGLAPVVPLHEWSRKC